MLDAVEELRVFVSTKNQEVVGAHLVSYPTTYWHPFSRVHFAYSLNLTTKLHLMAGLRMCEDINSLPHISP